MTQFVWVTEHGAKLLEASDEDEAYRKVIANRIAAGQTVEEADVGFDDSLHKIDGRVDDQPYSGPLSDEDEEDEDDED